MFTTERARPLARGQEGSDKQGREVEGDVRRKCRHGEERVYVCHRDPLEIVMGLHGWEIE